MTIENDRAVATSLVALLLLSWLGFVVHASPRFPGSLAGSMLGIAAASLIVGPTIVYAVVKRSNRLRRLLPPSVPMKRLLSWHIFAALAGALLGIVHTAHKFDSVVGIAVATALLVATATGYVARHFLGFVSGELREKQRWLAEARDPESIVDLQYAVAFHETLSGRAARWGTAHRVTGWLFLAVLGVHVFAAVYFGLRWL